VAPGQRTATSGGRPGASGGDAETCSQACLHLVRKRVAQPTAEAGPDPASADRAGGPRGPLASARAEPSAILQRTSWHELPWRDNRPGGRGRPSPAERRELRDGLPLTEEETAAGVTEENRTWQRRGAPHPRWVAPPPGALPGARVVGAESRNGSNTGARFRSLNQSTPGEAPARGS
jgi:hypothetical protein